MKGREQRRRSEWIQVAAAPEDKDLVQRIARTTDDGFVSRTVIRLIRQEGRRLGFLAEDVVPLPMEQKPETEAA